MTDGWDLGGGVEAVEVVVEAKEADVGVRSEEDE